MNDNTIQIMKPINVLIADLQPEDIDTIQQSEVAPVAVELLKRCQRLKIENNRHKERFALAEIEFEEIAANYNTMLEVNNEGAVLVGQFKEYVIFLEDIIYRLNEEAYKYIIEFPTPSTDKKNDGIYKKRFEADLLNVENKSESPIITEPSSLPAVPFLEVASEGANQKKAGSDETNRSVGYKRGKTSKYHYCYLDKKRGMYKADVIVNDERLSMKRNPSEVVVALAVDAFLDEHEDINTKKPKPRNRDEFPEVAEAKRLKDLELLQGADNEED